MDYVLDSFALLALLGNEPGAARVEELLLQAQAGQARVAMSVVNLGEVAYIVERRWGVAQLRSMLAYLYATPLQFHDVNQNRALAAAHLKAAYPLSYADAFAAALAQELGVTLVTGDPEFRPLALLISIEWLPQRP